MGTEWRVLYGVSMILVYILGIVIGRMFGHKSEKVEKPHKKSMVDAVGWYDINNPINRRGMDQ